MGFSPSEPGTAANSHQALKSPGNRFKDATMAEIALQHGALLADIGACHPGPHRAAFWWLGQHSFIVKAGGSVIYIDPFFAPWESRQTRTLLDFDEPNNADIVLVTHDHADHLCPESLSNMAR